MAQALTTVGNIAAWAKQDIATEYQDALTTCINAAGSMLEQLTGRTLMRATKTAYFDGKYALGASDEIWLDPGHRPVLHTGSDLVTVTVNGSSLTVSSTYSTTAGVILIGANEDAPCRLIRSAGPWSTGLRNIAVTYKCGWQTDPALVGTDSQPLPKMVEQLANEFAWLLFSEANWLGKANVSHAGAAVTIANELSLASKGILESLTVQV